MNILEEKIARDGVFKEGNIVKVDGFLNHLVDMDIIGFIAEEIARRYSGQQITKVLTVEASGIAIATAVAMELHVPMLFAKKSLTSNMDKDTFGADAFSFTHGCTNRLIVSKRHISKEDSILIVDDFLAEGAALSALIDITIQSGASVVGCAVAIEKGFQNGGKIIRGKGYRVESIARIANVDYKTQTVSFL